MTTSPATAASTTASASRSCYGAASGTLLAFAEGRADGCKPDVRGNRPIVVRASHDEGKTWGDIRIAGPALPSLGTNYPGAFVRADGDVLRYLVSNGSVFSTESRDEGSTWSPPVEASQPVGVHCGSMWPEALGASVVLPCGGNASAHGRRRPDVDDELDGGVARSQRDGPRRGAAQRGRPLADVALDVHPREQPRRLAQPRDRAERRRRRHRSAARLLPMVGATCEGSIGRDRRSSPGEVLLATIAGHFPGYLGRGNMSVWSLDTAAGADPVSKLDVWPQAAGYSDFAQARSGAMLLLYEAGGTVYDYGIKISPVDVGRGEYVRR